MESSKYIQMVLASNSSLFLDGMGRIIENEGNIKIAAQASNPKEVEKCLVEIKPGFLFIDNTTLDLNIDKLLNIIKKKSPGTRIILFDDQNEVRSNSPNITYITKKINSSDLINTIKNLSRGSLPREATPIDNIKRKPTKMEMKIIGLVVAGLSNKEIAKKLSISEKTVKAHLTNIFIKLGLRNRYQLIVWRKN